MQGLTNHDVATRFLDGMATYASVLEDNGAIESVIRRVHNMLWEFPEQNWIDAFSRYQILSKKWLTDEMIRICCNIITSDVFIHGDIYILGGWLGTLPYLMSRRGINYDRVFSIDIDPTVARVAERLNQEDGKVVGVTASANDLNYTADSFVVSGSAYSGRASLIINTSCEHFTDYQGWVATIPANVPVILQSNNMFGIDGHVNCKATLKEFVGDCGLEEILYMNEMDLGDAWKRYMIIGTKR